MTWIPKRFHIEISTICNSKCVTCPQSKVQRNPIIDVPRVEKLITEEMKEFQSTIELVELHNYNEPLMVPELFFRLAQLVNDTYGPGKLGMVTNGSIMSPEIADKLLALRLKHLIFSIDGFSKEVYESHRFGLRRDAVYRNVEYFIERSKEVGGIVPCLNYVVTRWNRGEVGDFIGYFMPKRCVPFIHTCDGRGGDEKEGALYDNFVEYPCDYALDGVYILSNLDIVPCCEDWSGKESFGNLGINTLSEILKCKKATDFRQMQLNENKRYIGLCHFCKTNMSYRFADRLMRI